MQSLYAAAREQGKYEAIGGHKATTAFRTNDKGQYLCTICGRALTGNGERHASTGRPRKKVLTPKP